MTTSCPQCDLYDHLRGARIRAEIHKRSEDDQAEARYQRFLAAYHARHTRQSGFSAGRFVALMAAVQEREENQHDEEHEGMHEAQFRTEAWNRD